MENPIKDSRLYGSVAWKECVENWKFGKRKRTQDDNDSKY
jgi:hypothetical protein